VNLSSTAVDTVLPTMAVYAATKAGVRALSEGLRNESGATVRVTTVSPGMTRTDFASMIADAETRARLAERRDSEGMEPAAVARAIAFAIEQPADVDVSEIVVRPTPATRRES
jgi:NADP-dependent 3-hydroxy acid dehydrogenase YdfG